MRENQTLIEDMVSLGGNILGNLMGARHELKAQAKQRMESVARQFGLVSREEFDAAFAMLAKARIMQEELAERLATIEAHLKMPAAKPQNMVKTLRPNLPSVKKSRRAIKRR